MAGGVPDVVRRERAAALLAEAAAARARFAARAAGGRRRVLFEERAGPGGDGGAGWIGHADDYVLVRVPAPVATSLEGEIAVVTIDGVDPADRERAVGRIEALVERPSPGGGAVAARAGLPATGGRPGAGGASAAGGAPAAARALPVVRFPA
jgi:hypothetical protein